MPSFTNAFLIEAPYLSAVILGGYLLSVLTSPVEPPLNCQWVNMEPGLSSCRILPWGTEGLLDLGRCDIKAYRKHRTGVLLFLQALSYGWLPRLIQGNREKLYPGTLRMICSAHGHFYPVLSLPLSLSL